MWSRIAIAAGRVLFVLPLLMAVSPGYTENAPLPHRGPWPIQHWHNIQPTEKQLRAMHVQDVTKRQGRRIGELYWELQSLGENGAENCNAFAIPSRDRARCRASLAKRAYVMPARPVPRIEAPRR